MKTCKLLRHGRKLTDKSYTSIITIPTNKFHSSNHCKFPVSDYDVFWLRQPRKWDFIEFGNHSEMHPGQSVPYQEARVLFARHIPPNKKRRPKSEDTFNRWWEIPPWEHDKPGARIPCTLNTQNKGIIDFTLDRNRVNVMDNDLRSKCTLFNLYIRSPQSLSMTPHQLIQESWKYYTNNNDSDNSNVGDTENSNYYLDRYRVNNELYNSSTLATKFVTHYQIFLKDVKKRMIFDDVESMHFEQYIPDQPMNIVVPIRFYGLDQWFPITRDGHYQWRV